MRRARPDRKDGRKRLFDSVEKWAVSGWFLWGIVSLFYFAASRGNGFIYDDAEVLLNEKLGASLHDLALVFAQRHYPFLPYYRPVTRLTFVIQKGLHGFEPAYFHLANALLAGAAAVVVYRFCRCRALRIEKRLAFAGALVFALHPLASSMVFPAASGRETLLPFILTVLGLLIYLGEGANRRWYAFGVAVLALFSKESGIILPFLYLAADLLGITKDRAKGLREWLRRAAPYAFLFVFYMWIRWQLFEGGEWHWDYNWRLVTGSFLYAIQSSFVPTWSLHFEPMSISAWFTPLRTALALALGAATLIGLSRSKVEHSYRWAALWGCVFVLGLLPTANIIVQDAYFSERYVILPLFALLMSVLAALGIFRSRRTIPAAAAIVAILLASVSWHRSHTFHDNVSFCRQWVATSPGYFLPYYNLGKSYELAGRSDLARKPYLESIRLNPRWPSSYLNLASLSISESKFEEALGYVRTYIELKPSSARGYYTAGVAFQGKGELDQASSCYERAIEIDPGFVDALLNLGTIRYETGNVAGARNLFTRILKIDPNHAAARRNLWILESNSGKGNVQVPNR